VRKEIIMSKVITVTLNPSLDRTMVTNFFNPGYPNRTTEHTRLDPAGRGVNISRALRRLDCDTNAVILLGNDAVSLSYRALIQAEQLPVTPIVREGRTRSNVIIVDSGNKTETQIVEESTVGTEEDITAILETLRGIVETGDNVVFAGDLTVEGPRDMYARLLQSVREMGAQVTLNTSGEALKRAVMTQPDRIIITRQELEGLVNYPVRTASDSISAAKSVLERGIKEVVVTMLGDPTDPAALVVSDDQVFVVHADIAERGTTSGVEGAFVGGFMGALCRGDNLESALKLGTAAAGYTASQIGSEFGTLADLSELIQAIEIEQG
jgi:1-phosphofructokinase